MHPPRTLTRLAAALLAVAAPFTSTFALATPAQTVSDDVAFETREVTREHPNCQPPKGDDPPECATISFVYPEITKAPNGMADRLNRFVMDRLLSLVPGGPEGTDKPASIDAAIEAFFRDYAEARKEYPDMPVAWSREASAEIYFSSPRIVSFVLNVNEYTGGAHPNGITTMTTVDLKTGEPLKVSDVFASGSSAKLDALVEKELRRVREVPDGQSLEEAGFFPSDDGKIHANDNFAFGEEGVLFFYNNYEIAPYVMGPSEVMLSYASVRPLLTKEAAALVPR